MIVDRVSLFAEQLDQLVAAAERAFPEECCGLLFGNKPGSAWQILAIRPMRNASKRPRAGFEFDAGEQLRAYRDADAAGLELLGHYHSHPNARAGPSPTDLQLAQTRMDHDLWLILAVESGKCSDFSVWQLHEEPGVFERVELCLLNKEIEGD